MNPVVIFLGVIVVLLLYYLYKFYLSTTTLTSQINLNTSQPSIPLSSLSNPNTANYSYGVWVYVNSWNNASSKVIVSRGSDFSLSLDANTPTLRCNIKSSVDATANSDIVITPSFPIQTWCFIVISVNNQVVDCYLNGKLTVSKKLASLPVISKNPIQLGGGPMDIFLTQLNYWPNPMNPQLAWNYYLQGNGLSTGSNYNVKLSVLEDNIETKHFSIF